MNSFLPGLYIVSTPIGNLEDITLRALNVLKNSDKILCEDTRRSIKLLNYYGIKKKLIANHKFNEKKIAESMIQLIESGEKVSIISDAGTPTFSDPGLVLIKECIKRKINVYSALALNNEIDSKNWNNKKISINKNNLEYKNFFSELGIFLLER